MTMAMMRGRASGVGGRGPWVLAAGLLVGCEGSRQVPPDPRVAPKVERVPQPVAEPARQPLPKPKPEPEPKPPVAVTPAKAPTRVAVFNTSLSREAPGQLRAELAEGTDARAKSVAAILQTVRPELVLLLEVDRDPEALARFERSYLAVPQPGGGEGLVYPHRFVPPTNTGEPSGFDLDRDGRSDGPGDALGYGKFPGQYGMVVLSRPPIDEEGIRCFGELRWRDVDGARLPDDPATPEPSDWYSPEALQVLPLSSKNHCVVPVSIGEERLYLLASHPVPPVFDGPEDRNGLRNHDEIRLLAQLLDGGPDLAPTLGPAARFVIAGDLNADPHDGDSSGDPIGRWLLQHPRVAPLPVPSSRGAEAAALRDGGANPSHVGPAEHDTADFPDLGGAPGNLRTDYVLPSKTLEVVDAGVFWPAPGEAGAELVGCSDHRLVWIDVR